MVDTLEQEKASVKTGYWLHPWYFWYRVKNGSREGIDSIRSAWFYP